MIFLSAAAKKVQDNQRVVPLLEIRRMRINAAGKQWKLRLGALAGAMALAALASTAQTRTEETNARKEFLKKLVAAAGGENTSRGALRSGVREDTVSGRGRAG